MAVTYGFYNALNHDRLYDAIQMSSIFDGIIRDGIFSTIGDTMIVTAPEDGMYVNVGSGRAWFNHTWTLNDTDYPIEAEEAEVVLDRIDAVILEVNSSAEVRANSIKFLKGTPSSNPVKPTLTHNAEVNQYALAYVRIRAGQTTIFQSDIENAVGTDETPFITGVLQQVSIETLLKQWEAEFNTYFTNFKNTSTTEFNNWFAAKISEYTAWFAQMQTDMDSNFNEFDAWFQRMKDQLDENQAGHLQLQIDDLSGRIDDLDAEMPFAGGSKVNINFEYDVKPNIQYSNEHYKLTVGDTVRENNFSASKLHFDEYGILTVGDGILEVTYDVTDSRTGKITHASYTYTINMPYFGRFAYNVTISASLYNYQGWLESIGKDASSYQTIEDVFADEKLLRELMTRHASVDYLVEWLAYDNEDAHTVLNNDYCAKWINLRDYALDKLYANPTVKAVMDEVNKYGYGEWALVGQVPIMTSNTTPSGKAFASTELSTSYAAWKAFNGTNSDGYDCWHNTSSSTMDFLGYEFVTPVVVKALTISNRNGGAFPPRKFDVQGSNDGSTWNTVANDLSIGSNQSGESFRFDFSNNVAYKSWRILTTERWSATDNTINVGKLQFYAWQPKGNVPVMTSNTAPYGEVSSSSVYSGRSAYAVFSASSTTTFAFNSNSGWLTYKFTNPILVKKMMFENVSGDAIFSPKGFTVQASNDNSTWENLTTIAHDTTAGKNTYYDIPNTSYYIYYRISISGSQSSEHTYCHIEQLQFYGRELKVSVPKMTSNTAPWGEAFTEPAAITNYEAFRMFSGSITDSTNGAGGVTSVRNSIAKYGYKFNKEISVKFISFGLRYYKANTQYPVKYYVEYSNDGATWNRIKENGSDKLFNVVLNGTTSYKLNNFIVINDNINAKMWRINAIEGNEAVISIMTLNFYGLDYSEREFEEGSTMKYLYDHGVELEPIDGFSTNSSSAFYTKEPNQLYVNKTANNVISLFNTANGIDISPYKLLRGIAGDKFAYDGGNVDISIRPAHNDTSQAISQNNLSSNFNELPNNIFLDVSSINSVAYPVMTTNDGGTVISMSLKEWWLE